MDVMHAVAGEATSEEHAALIGPGDPPVYEYVPGASTRALLLCDHASNAVPRSLDRLGLPDEAFGHHIAMDLHAEQVTRLLANEMGLPAFLHGYSRLVVDANRRLGCATLCPAVADGTPVPGNAGLGEAARMQRWQQIHQPYHHAIADWLRLRREQGIHPALISIHSFTERLRVGGGDRPWPIAVLWNRDGRMALPFMAAVREREGVLVGDNEPYSGRDSFDYTIVEHAECNGLPHLLIELRQDVIATEAGREHWSRLLARTIAPLLADPHLYTPFS